MQNNKFRILFISQDPLISKQIQDQLKSSFPSLNIKYHFLDNSSDATGLSKSFLPHLILAPASWLNSEAKDFEQEIMRASGLTHIIFFGKNLQVSSKTIGWPITQWGELTEAIHDFIPQEIKDAAGLHKKDSALYNLLAAYGQKYQSSDDSFPEKQLGLIPSRNSPLTQTKKENTIAPEKNLMTFLPFKNWLLFEIFMLIALAALSGWFYQIEELTLFYFSATTTSLALVSMYFNHFLIPKIKEAK